jgi:hypothetical protein
MFVAPLHKIIFSEYLFLFINMLVRTSFFILAIFLLNYKVSKSQSSLMVFDKPPFKCGEYFTFSLHYGIINAGKADVWVEKEIQIHKEKPCYKLTVHGYSIGFWRTVFRIEDVWSSLVDTLSLQPKFSQRLIEEGKYHLREDVNYEYNKTAESKAHIWRKHPDRGAEEFHFKVPNPVEDVVSGFYAIRRIDFEKMKKGDTLIFNTFVDKENYKFKIRYMGKGMVSTDAGKFKAIKLVPIMPPNKLFKGEESLKFWISDDKNKIPLLAEAHLFVGSVKLELNTFKGLKHSYNVTK